MTTSIPYSFVPGTKAMASEVNANFLALANALDDDKTYFNNQINDLNSSIQNLSDAINSEITKKLHKNVITNCIIETPSEMFELENNTITIKAGLKVFMPDGRNTDGSLKNIEYTVENDITYTETSSATNSNLALLLHKNGALSASIDYFAQPHQPVRQYSSWLNTAENILYSSVDNANSWTVNPYSGCCIGYFNRDNGVLSNFKPLYPVELLKASDYQRLLSWMTPDYTTITEIGSGFIVPLNGWVLWYGGIAGDNSGVHMWINNIQIGYHGYYKYGDNYAVLYPVNKNDVITFDTHPSIGTHYIKCRGVY